MAEAAQGKIRFFPKEPNENKPVRQFSLSGYMDMEQQTRGSENKCLYIHAAPGKAEAAIKKEI